MLFLNFYYFFIGKVFYFVIFMNTLIFNLLLFSIRFIFLNNCTSYSLLTFLCLFFSIWIQYLLYFLLMLYLSIILKKKRSIFSFHRVPKFPLWLLSLTHIVFVGERCCGQRQHLRTVKRHPVQGPRVPVIGRLWSAV